MASRLVLQQFNPYTHTLSRNVQKCSPLCRCLVEWPLTETVGMAAGEAAACGPEGSSPWRSPAWGRVKEGGNRR